MQTINQLNQRNQILHSNIAIKDATIEALQETINNSSNMTISPAEPSMVIVVPSSDEIDHHRGKDLTVKYQKVNNIPFIPN